MKRAFTFRPKIAEGLISCILIAILGFGVYANCIKGAFIWDDDYLVENNAYLKSWSYVPNILTSDVGAGSGRIFHFFRPLQILTYRLDYSLWGLNPAGFHLTNIIIHILVALCILWMCNIIFCDYLLSSVAAALFTIHPIHTEAVAYISARADLLSALFMLMCFIFYVKYYNIKSIKIFYIMLVCYILALFSKEYSVVLIILILFYHYAFKVRLQFKIFLVLLLAAVSFFFLRINILNFSSPASLVKSTFLERVPGFFVAIANYIALLFFPLELHMEYGMRLFNFSYPPAIMGFLISCLLIFYAFIKRKENRVLFFSVFWFFLTMLPVSNLYPLNAYMAEHWLYLPSIGFFVILSNILVSLYRGKKTKILALLLVVSLAIGYSYLTELHNRYWVDQKAFYERILAYAPDSPRACNNLGVLYKKMGNYKEATALFEKAIRIEPNKAIPYYNLGNIYNDLGKYQKAIVLYNKAIEFNSRDAMSYNNLGVVYSKIGMYEKARESYERAALVNPLDSAVQYNLAKAYYRNKRYAESIKHSDAALKLGYPVEEEFLELLKPYRK